MTTEKKASVSKEEGTTFVPPVGGPAGALYVEEAPFIPEYGDEKKGDRLTPPWVLSDKTA
jgi:hypothetical protein